jgi:predicted nuclease of predicted toxin-antitoxin system
MVRREVAQYLREHGHDVVRAEEIGEDRAPDDVLLATARREQRILVTLDGHFGDWVVLPLSRHPGVIRLKVHPPTPSAIERVLTPFLAAHDQGEFADMLVILSPKRVRWIRTAP